MATTTNESELPNLASCVSMCHGKITKMGHSSRFGTQRRSHSSQRGIAKLNLLPIFSTICARASIFPQVRRRWRERCSQKNGLKYLPQELATNDSGGLFFVLRESDPCLVSAACWHAAGTPSGRIAVMLVLSRKIGEKLIIGDNITVVVSRVAGNRVTLGIEAPSDVRIIRGELHVDIDDSSPLARSNVSFHREADTLTASVPRLAK